MPRSRPIVGSFSHTNWEEAPNFSSQRKQLLTDRDELQTKLEKLSQMLPNTLHRNCNIEGANQQLEALASPWMTSGAEQSKIWELQEDIASHVQEQAYTDMPRNCFNAKFPTHGHGNCNTSLLERLMAALPESYLTGNVYGNNVRRQKPLCPGIVYPSVALGPQVVPPPPPPAALESALAIASVSEDAHSTMRSPSNDEYKIPVAKSLPIPTRLVSPTCVPKRRTPPLASDIHTLIIKKIPARIAPSNLLELWPAYQSYNLLYLPYNHRTRRTAGFVIVNFISNEAAVAFWQRWQGQFLLHESCAKKLDICVAEVQGLVENLIAMKKNKKITRMKNVRYLPVIVLPDGTPTDFKKLMDTIQLPPECGQKESDGNSSDGESVQEHEQGL